MSSITGGDVLEITCNHPELGSFVFSPKSAEDFTLDPGGFRADDDANNVDGQGRRIKKMNRVMWSAEGTITWDMNSTDELTSLKKLAAHPVDGDWTFTSINDTVWKGKGSPVGDIKGSMTDATIDVVISGGGDCTKIVG